MATVLSSLIYLLPKRLAFRPVLRHVYPPCLSAMWRIDMADRR